MAADQLEQLGKALGPTYSQLRTFGGGGMGTLFSAHDDLLDREIVVKVVRLFPGFADEKEATIRLKREAKLASGLNHPNIVPVHFAGEYGADDSGEGRGFFFVMKRIFGKPLNDVRKVPAVEATRILRDIAWALDHSHGSGVFHRDIKPENIRIEDHTRKPILLDFGLAIDPRLDRLTRYGVFIGTPGYMSPEQFRSRDLADPRVDIYALGEIGFFLLTGRDPFVLDLGPEELLENKRAWTRADLVEAAPEAPPGLVEIVAKCMNPDPTARYRSAVALARALDGVMPSISVPSLWRSINAGVFDFEWWAACGRNAGLSEALSSKPAHLSIHILRDWLDAFGYASIEELAEKLQVLRPQASTALSGFVASCPTDERPYAVAIDVIRIVLGIEHRVSLDFPHLSLPYDPLARQIGRYLKTQDAGR